MTERAAALERAFANRMKGTKARPSTRGGGARRTIASTVVTALALLSINVGATALVSRWGGSFSPDDVMARVLSQDASARVAHERYAREDAPASERRPSFRVSAGSNSPWSLALFVNMFALWLLLEPNGLWRRLREPALWGVAAMVCSVLVGITWAQSAFVGTYAQGRRVFAFANFDIDPGSFVWQAARLALVSLLLSAMWARRRAMLEDTRKELDQLETEASAAQAAPAHARIYAGLGAKLAATFAAFQLDSLLVVAAFAPLAWGYWLYLFPYGDLRYAVLAVVFYVLWFGTWALVCAPLWHAKQRWTAQHFRVLEAATAENDAHEAERWMKLLEATKPLTAGNLIGTALLAVASIVPPLSELWK
jgi:hypothetical protein